MLARCFGRYSPPSFLSPFLPSSFAHRLSPTVPFPFTPPSLLLLLALTFTALYTFLPPTLFHLVSILERETQLRAWFLRFSLAAVAWLPFLFV